MQNKRGFYLPKWKKGSYNINHISVQDGPHPKQLQRGIREENKRASTFELRITAGAVPCFLLSPVFSLQTGTKPWSPS